MSVSYTGMRSGPYIVHKTANTAPDQIAFPPDFNSHSLA